jgi:SAM-dependent methyltransferase
MLHVPTRVLPKAAVDLLKRSPAVYGCARSVRFGMGRLLGARVLPGIPGRVHYNDFMLKSSRPEEIADYRRCAEEFIETLQRALARCGRGWDDLDGVMEIGCGYGRIVRQLISKVPSERVWVCDVIDEAATFTAGEFSVHKTDPVGGASFPRTACFDLVYLLSVFTHLAAAEIARILEAVDQATRAGAVLVFTVHGWASANRCLVNYPAPWPARGKKIIAALETSGEYYERYPYYKQNVGMAWHAPEFVEQLVARACQRFRMVHFGDGEHDGHQDVFVFCKEAP